MVKRAATVVAVALLLVALPFRASAQTPEIEESEAGIPYARIDTGRDDPYRMLDFETAGEEMSPLDDAIVAASDADEEHLLWTAPGDLGGFQDAPIGGGIWVANGVSLTGVGAPRVTEGSALSSTTALTPSATVPGDGDANAAIPRVSSSTATGDAGRTSFGFADDETGELIAPPDDLPPLVDPPAPPSEGIDASPTTTTTTAPASEPGTTAPTPTTTEAPPTPSTAAPTTTTSTTTTETTSTTSAPTTSTTTSATTTTTTTAPTTTTTRRSTTTRPPATTTTTRAPTTTTTLPLTTTTTLPPPTTTTTAPPPSDDFTLTQSRPSATACVAPTGSVQACDAIWSIPLAATGETASFDITLRNDGNLDASALQVWAGAACATTSTGSPAGTGDLCDAVQLTVQRYTTDERDVPLECVYGGGTAQVCSLSSLRTLTHFSSTYPSGSQPRAIGTGLNDGESCYLRLTLGLPDVDNRYQRRAATMSLTWRQVQ